MWAQAAWVTCTVPKKLTSKIARKLAQVELVKRCVLVDARVVDEHVEASPRLEGLAHHAFARAVTADIVPIGDRFAACGQYLRHDAIGAAAACGVHFPAAVVDDDAQPMLR